MADDSLEGVSVRFRDDILRGVRLFAIVFALILVAVWIYRTIRAQSDVRGASQDVSAAPETTQPVQQTAPAPAPVFEPVAETHGLTVPPPPPVAGTPAPRIIRPRVAANPATKPATQQAKATASANHAQAPSGRDFEAAQPVALPVAPVGDSSNGVAVPAKTAVGYKSLIETNANRVTVIHVPPPVEEPAEQPAKGNRFVKAVGKIFHGGKKDKLPLTLQEPKHP
jgi:hypothetical protein